MQKLLIALSFIAPAFIITAEASHAWLVNREIRHQYSPHSFPVSYFNFLKIDHPIKPTALREAIPFAHHIATLASTIDNQLLAILTESKTHDESDVILYSTHNNQQTEQFVVPYARTLALSLSRLLVIGSMSDVQLFDTAGKQMGRLPVYSTCRSLACSPSDDRVVAPIDYNYDFSSSAPALPYRVTEFDLPTQQKIHDYGKHYNLANIIYSPNGEFLLIGKSKLETTLFDVRAGKPAIDLPMTKGYHGVITAVACASNNKYVATASTLGRIFLWDIRTRRLIETEDVYERVNKHFSDHDPLYKPMRRINSIAFSPDSSAIVTGDEDWLIKIHSIHDLSEVHIAEEAEGVYNMLFLQNNVLVTSTTNSAVRLWVPD